MYEYIIYLHPKINSRASKKMITYWKALSKEDPNNRALMYPPHATLTRFFKTEHPKEISNSLMLLFKKLKPPLFKRAYYNNKNFLGLALENNEFSEFIKQALKEVYDLIDPSMSFESLLRTLFTLHITLYFSQYKEVNPDTVTGFLNLEDWGKEEWNIVMWQVERKEDSIKWLRNDILY